MRVTQAMLVRNSSIRRVCSGVACLLAAVSSSRRSSQLVISVLRLSALVAMVCSSRVLVFDD